MEVSQMTDKQFDKIIKMIRMVLDGCKDLEEAKQKVEELLEDLDHIMAKSAPYTMEDWNHRGIFRKMFASLFRLGAIWL